MSHLFKAVLLSFAWGQIGIPVAWADGNLNVFVSIAPQKYFVQQIGMDKVDVNIMVPPGAAPHTYEPRPRQMVALSKADLYLAIGVAFEKAWLKKFAAASPDMRIVHTDQGIVKIPMSDHHHDGGHEHHDGRPDAPIHEEHGGFDPHIWLAPHLVKKQARTILTALQESDPENRNTYATNFKRFAASIDTLDAELKAIFEGHQGLQFIVFHPAWGYFARAYGLRQVPVELEGKAPKPAQLKALIEHARRKGIQVIFAQPQFSTKSAGLVAKEIGGQVVFADPLAEDWAGNMQQMAEKFNAALR